MADRTVWCDNNPGQNPTAWDVAFGGEGVWPKSSVRLKVGRGVLTAPWEVARTGAPRTPGDGCHAARTLGSANDQFRPHPRATMVRSKSPREHRGFPGLYQACTRPAPGFGRLCPASQGSKFEVRGSKVSVHHKPPEYTPPFAPPSGWSGGTLDKPWTCASTIEPPQYYGEAMGRPS